MKHRTASASGKLHTATLAPLPPSKRGGERLFAADMSWATDQAPSRREGRLQRFLRGMSLGRAVLLGLLALAVVGIVMMNGPADAVPSQAPRVQPLPRPVGEAVPAGPIADAAWIARADLVGRD